MAAGRWVFNLLLGSHDILIHGPQGPCERFSRFCELKNTESCYTKCNMILHESRESVVASVLVFLSNMLLIINCVDT